MNNILLNLTKYTYSFDFENIIMTLIIIIIVVLTVTIPILLAYAIWRIHKELKITNAVLLRQNEILEDLIKSNKNIYPSDTNK